MDENDVRIVRLTNIADFDFTGELGARYGGRDFFVAAGGSLLMPFTVADHLATHLARQILLKKAPNRDAKEVDGRGSDRPLWDDGVIAELKTKILADVYEEEKKPQLSEADRLAEKVKELNKVTAEMETDIGGEVVADLPTEISNAPVTEYKDKAQIIAELEKRGIRFDARASKSRLEELLK